MICSELALFPSQTEAASLQFCSVSQECSAGIPKAVNAAWGVEEQQGGHGVMAAGDGSGQQPPSKGAEQHLTAQRFTSLLIWLKKWS